MRVIAGRAKGHQLKGPKGPAIRPTSDKVRGAIFAMLESLLEMAWSPAGETEEAGPWDGLRVLDLYAGTGALGIEALSRGAASADFVDASPAACQLIRENLAHTKLAAFGRVHCTAVRQFLGQLWRQSVEGTAQARGYDLVLMDPPYAEPDLEDVLKALGSQEIVGEDGWLVVEHSRRRALPAEVTGLTLVKEKRYGDTNVSIYARRRAAQTAVAMSGRAPDRE